jgi:hypothetical protein
MINPNQAAAKMQVMKGFRRQWLHSADRHGLLTSFEPDCD